MIVSALSCGSMLRSALTSCVFRPPPVTKAGAADLVPFSAFRPIRIEQRVVFVGMSSLINYDFRLLTKTYNSPMSGRNLCRDFTVSKHEVNDYGGSVVDTHGRINRGVLVGFYVLLASTPVWAHPPRDAQSPIDLLRTDQPHSIHKISSF